jgi:hypothetical protein
MGRCMVPECDDHAATAVVVSAGPRQAFHLAACRRHGQLTRWWTGQNPMARRAFLRGDHHEVPSAGLRQVLGAEPFAVDGAEQRESPKLVIDSTHLDGFRQLLRSGCSFG